jgi:hypothetical protein
MELGPSVADAKVEKRPHIVTAQLGHQVHLGRPRSNAPHGNEFRDDLLVAHTAVTFGANGTFYDFDG